MVVNKCQAFLAQNPTRHLYIYKERTNGLRDRTTGTEGAEAVCNGFGTVPALGTTRARCCEGWKYYRAWGLGYLEYSTDSSLLSCFESDTGTS